MISVSSDKKKESTATVPTALKFPTPEQMLELWDKHFEPLLEYSDKHDPDLLQTFEADTLTYIKTKTIKL